MWSGALDDFTASPQHRILIKGQQVELLFDESAVLMPGVHMIDGENTVRQRTGKRYLHLHHVPATRDHFCQWLS
jgi:hypothetical protein